MKKLKELLFRSLNGEEKSLWKLIDENEYDLRTIITTINEILGKDIGFNEEKKKFYLLRHFPFKYIDFRCGKCKGRGYEPKIFKQTLDDFNRVTKNRPLPIAEYDQGIVAPYDLAIKAGFMYQRGDLAGKEILVLGDDDLFSIFIGLTKLPKRIVVLDIDRRILKFIKEISIFLKIKEYDQLFRIGTDIIVGFPNETEEDFDQTINFIKKWKPSILNISKYSVRPNTEAKKYHQLNSQVIKERSRKISKVFLKYSEILNKQWNGWKGDIFFNEYRENVQYPYMGRNLYYVPILCNKGTVGQSKKIKITGYLNHSLIGILL